MPAPAWRAADAARYRRSARHEVREKPADHVSKLVRALATISKRPSEARRRLHHQGPRGERDVGRCPSGCAPIVLSAKDIDPAIPFEIAGIDVRRQRASSSACSAGNVDSLRSRTGCGVRTSGSSDFASCGAGVDAIGGVATAVCEMRSQPARYQWPAGTLCDRLPRRRMRQTHESDGLTRPASVAKAARAVGTRSRPTRRAAPGLSS